MEEYTQEDYYLKPALHIEKKIKIYFNFTFITIIITLHSAN